MPLVNVPQRSRVVCCGDTPRVTKAPYILHPTPYTLNRAPYTTSVRPVSSRHHPG